MKVILVQSPARNIMFNIGGYFKVLPLSIAYIVKKLKENNIDFDIFYPKESKNFFSRFRRYLELQKHSPAIVGISATLFSAREAFKLAQITKSINSGNIVIIGGAITSFSAESIFRYSNNIDYIISGEGEQALLSLVLALKSNLFTEPIPNVSYRDNSRIVSHREEYLQDLDYIGIPLREAFPKWTHNLHPPMGRYSPAYLVETIRGCDFKCMFCSLPKNMRMRSIGTVIEELQVLRKHFRAKEVHFIDPTFTIDKNRTYNLCRQMIDEKIGLHWSCKSRVDCVDTELLEIMKAAGCYMIHFGVESGTPQILEEVNKEQTAEDTIIAFDACNKLGIRTGAFMLLASTRHDSKETVKQAIDFIKRIRPTYVLYDQIKPIPNRPFVFQAEKATIITEEDSEEFYLGDREKSRLSKITMSGIPRKVANKWVSRASRSFFLSPRSVMRILFGLRTKNDWLNLLKAGSYYFREMFKQNEW